MLATELIRGSSKNPACGKRPSRVPKVKTEVLDATPGPSPTIRHPQLRDTRCAVGIWLGYRAGAWFIELQSRAAGVLEVALVSA